MVKKQRNLMNTPCKNETNIYGTFVDFLTMCGTNAINANRFLMNSRFVGFKKKRVNKYNKTGATEGSGLGINTPARSCFPTDPPGRQEARDGPGSFGRDIARAPASISPV